MKRTAVSTLKATLSACLAKVKAGDEVLVMERGKPIAKLVPLAKESDRTLAHLHDLARAGLVRVGRGARSRHSWQSGPRHDEILGCLCTYPIVPTGAANRPVKKARSRGRGNCGLVGFAGRMFIGTCTPQKRGCAQYCRRRAGANGVTGSHDQLDGGGTEWVGTRTSRARAAPPPTAGSRCASVGSSPGVVSGRSNSPCFYLSRPTVTRGSSTRGVSYPSAEVVVSVPASIWQSFTTDAGGFFYIRQSATMLEPGDFILKI